MDDKNLIAQAVEEDPVVRFFVQNQKVISYLVIAVLLSVIGYRYYNTSHTKGQQRSAEMFFNLRNTYQDIEAGKEVDTNERQFEGTLVTLQEQKYPYNILARNYKQLKLITDGKYAEALKVAETTKWKEIDPQNQSLIWNELLIFSLAKSLTEQADFSEKAIQILLDLAQNGKFVAISAVKALESFAEVRNDQALRNQVRELNEALLANRPEQSELLS